VSGSNSVINGGFETGGSKMSPWVFRNQAGAALARDTVDEFQGTASARITIPTASENNWFVQLQAAVPPVVVGRPYLVSFVMKASQARRANVRLQSSDEPFATEVESDLAVSTTWQRYEITWTPTVGVTNAFLGFNLAQDTGTVWIDDVSMVRRTTGPISTVAGGGTPVGGPPTDGDPAGPTSVIGAIGDPGFPGDGGPATSAVLHEPQSTFVDAAGNLYVADRHDARVRKVTPDGTIATVAGNGAAGSTGDGGPATDASIGRPDGVTVDASGSLYIVESDADQVRKVAPDGTISTVAGNGAAGFSGDGGPAVDARLDHPTDVVTDASGNLYIADWNNNRVRMVTPAGTISTFAGNEAHDDDTARGGATVDRAIGHPTSLAVDLAGNVYIANSTCSVYRIAPVLALSLIALMPCGMDPVDVDIGVDAAGNVTFVQDVLGVVYRLTTSGTSSVIAGNGVLGSSGDGGAATAASLRSPVSVAVDNAGNVYVADRLSDVVRKITLP
jgi:hypothetical protein